jgi:DNA-binding Xre family transcriptional regulator
VNRNRRRPMPTNGEYNDALKAIGERIRKRRVERRLSNVQLADMLGLSVPAVKKIQHGSACIQFHKLSEICRALESDPNHLLGFEQASRDRLAAVLEIMLETVGVAKPAIEEMVAVAVEAASTHSVTATNVDPLQAARVQVYLAARRALGTSPR